MAYVEIFDNKLQITVPVEKVIVGIKENLEEVLNNLPIEVIPVKRLSKAQNGLIHVLLKQFGDELGWDLKDMKEYQKEQFVISRDLEEFSTSKCDMEMANNFISFIIEQALENEINLYIMNKQDKRYRHILEIDKMTERYVIACLKSKTCAICGRNGADLHHWNSVASIGGYKFDDGLKTPFLPLCRVHHTEFHNVGKEDFKNKYHIEGVWLNERLVKELKKIYKGHFKAYKGNSDGE